MYSSDPLPNICWPSNLDQCHFPNNIPTSFNMKLNEIGASYATYVLKMENSSLKSLSSSLNCLGINTSCNGSSVPVFLKSFVTIGLTWSSTFWFLGLCKTLGFIFYSPLVSLTDAVTFVTLGSANGNKFGFTRMFGTIGVLVCSVVMMGLLQLVNTLDTGMHWQWVSAMQRFSQFTPCFIVAGFIFISIMITASFLRIDKPIKSDKFLKSLSVIFQDCEIAVFFLFAVIGGFLLQVFAEYFFLIMYQRYSPLPKYFPGLVTVVMTVSEGIIFGFSSHLFKFKSYEIWVSLSFLAWSLKWFAYIYVENFWFLLLTEALHGPSFALMLASMMSHIGKIGNANTQGRIQGLFSAVYFNIGGACGGLVGGIVLDNLKYLGLFKFMACLSLICCIYHPLQVYFISLLCKPSRKQTIVLAVENPDGDCNEKHLLSLDPIS